MSPQERNKDKDLKPLPSATILLIFQKTQQGIAITADGQIKGSFLPDQAVREGMHYYTPQQMAESLPGPQDGKVSSRLIIRIGIEASPSEYIGSPGYVLWGSYAKSMGSPKSKDNFDEEIDSLIRQVIVGNPDHMKTLWERKD